MKKILLYITVVVCSVNMTCEEEDFYNEEVCDKMTLVDENVYADLESDDFNLINAEIINNCINITVGASGCDGNSWVFNLIDSGAVAESSPEQRYLKLQLLNGELCDAYFEKTISFNLTPLQINGSHEIILHLEDLDTSLNYKY